MLSYNATRDGSSLPYNQLNNGKRKYRPELLITKIRRIYSKKKNVLLYSQNFNHEVPSFLLLSFLKTFAEKIYFCVT
jgi:hypothetical protein